MVDTFIIQTVGNYSENNWTNPRTGEIKVIKSLPLVLSNGNDSFIVEANDDKAEAIKALSLKADDLVIASLSFTASRTEKDGIVRYFQRVRLEHLVKK